MNLPLRSTFTDHAVARVARGWILSLLLAAAASAHPLHTSTAEADYNRTTHQLEVALRVFIDDFETALSAHLRRPVSVEKTPPAEFDRLAQAYLAERFTVRLPGGTLAPRKWVGRELREAANELWFYFELPLPDGIEGARLHHRALGEHFSDQINSVRVRDGSRRVTLVFLPTHGEKAVRFHP